MQFEVSTKTQMSLIEFKGGIILPNQLWYYSWVMQEDLMDYVTVHYYYTSKWHCINNDIGFFQGASQVIIFKTYIETQTTKAALWGPV